MKSVVIVPAFNEEKHLDRVLSELGSYVNEIIVVDDGSSDKTAEIAREHKVHILSMPVNRGLGATLRLGFEYALKIGADLIITHDADGQHNPQDIQKIIAKLNDNDVVIGSRMFYKKGMPLARVLANKIANFVTKGGSITTDSQSGLRGFRADAIRKMNLTSDKWEISSEIIEEIARLKLRYAEVPIEAIYTDYSLSKGQNFINGIKTWGRLLIMRLFK